MRKHSHEKPIRIKERVLPALFYQMVIPGNIPAMARVEKKELLLLPEKNPTGTRGAACLGVCGKSYAGCLCDGTGAEIFSGYERETGGISDFTD